MTTHSEVEEHQPNDHAGPVDSYELNGEMVSNHHQQVAGKHLGKNMDGKWTELATKVTMRKIGGTEQHGNACQASPITFSFYKGNVMIPQLDCFLSHPNPRNTVG